MAFKLFVIRAEKAFALAATLSLSMLQANAAAFDFGSLASDGLKAVGKALKKEESQDRLSMHKVMKGETEYVEKVFRPLEVKAGLGLHNLAVYDTPLVQGIASILFGAVRVTRGMLNVIKSEAELAGYLGHELGHFASYDKGRHKRYTGEDLLDAGLKATGDGHSSTAFKIRDQHREFSRSIWSKDEEANADKYGAMLAYKAGYDPYALARLFERLAENVDEGFIYGLKKLKGSHHSLRDRASALREYLKTEGLVEGHGFEGEEEYQAALASLEKHQGGAGIAEQQLSLEKEEAKISNELKVIKSKVKGHVNQSVPMDYVDYVRLMERLSRLAMRYGIRPEELEKFHSQADGRFMEEELFQNWPVWNGYRGHEADKNRTSVLEVLKALGTIAVGAIPVVGDTTDVYEALVGRDFFSGESLSPGQRSLAALGVLVGSGKLWREAAGGIGAGLDALAVARKAGSTGEARAFLSEAMDAYDNGVEWKRHYAKVENAGIKKANPRYEESYWNGTSVYDAKVPKDSVFYRVHGRNQHGQFMMSFDPRNVEAEELRKMFSIPKTPSKVSKVTVKKDQPIRVSVAGPNAHGTGGGIQWELKCVDCGETYELLGDL